jgi:hypothetical protein
VGWVNWPGDEGDTDGLRNGNLADSRLEDARACHRRRDRCGNDTIWVGFANVYILVDINRFMVVDICWISINESDYYRDTFKRIGIGIHHGHRQRCKACPVGRHQFLCNGQAGLAGVYNIGVYCAAITGSRTVSAA